MPFRSFLTPDNESEKYVHKLNDELHSSVESEEEIEETLEKLRKREEHRKFEKLNNQYYGLIAHPEADLFTNRPPTK